MVGRKRTAGKAFHRSMDRAQGRLGGPAVPRFQLSPAHSQLSIFPAADCTAACRPAVRTPPLLSASLIWLVMVN